MIHSGAAVAAGVSQGKSTTLDWWDMKIFRWFRTDEEKREFVSAGAAAGVSAAFGAPIGGVLFSLEEGSSFWSQSLTWRSLACSMSATYVLNVLLSNFSEGRGPRNVLSSPGLLNFGEFTDMPYNFYELPLFVGIGISGGLLGALFNGINTYITRFRMRYVQGKFLRFTEAMMVATLTTGLAFTMIVLSSECLPLGDEPLKNPQQMFCPDHQYNAAASLWFNTPETAIRSLFHADRDQYELPLLTAFGALYLLIACLTYGIAVPSGLFVPCILIGAAWGRMVGTILSDQYPDMLWAEPGKYALIGSAAFLGGVVRMTISLAVIIIEATGNITYSLPVILTLIAAKWTGDLFNEGLYDIHIHLKHIPLLEWEAPVRHEHTCSPGLFVCTNFCLRPRPERAYMMGLYIEFSHCRSWPRAKVIAKNRFTAADIMTSAVQTLPRMVQVGSFVHTFLSCFAYAVYMEVYVNATPCCGCILRNRDVEHPIAVASIFFVRPTNAVLTIFQSFIEEVLMARSSGLRWGPYTIFYSQMPTARSRSWNTMNKSNLWSRARFCSRT